jgi:ABC-type transport system involved in multi-copper enzyme maturation permease subunit
MLNTIIRKEILENILSYRFPLFFLICAALIMSSIYVNYLDYTKRVSDYNEQIRLTGEALTSSRMWDVVSGNVPLKGFRRPSPLSIFAHGFESTLPTYFEFQADGSKQGDTPFNDESVLSVHGKFDFLFIAQMVLSLIVLLFASDTISGEKELGTLRGMLSNSIPRHNVLAGKILGGFAALWLPLVVTFLAAIVFLSLTAFPLFERDILARILVVLLATSVFMLTYFAMGTMVSANSARVRTSLVVILLVWMFFQLIVPKLSDIIASVVYPIRTEVTVSMEKSLVQKTLDEERAKVLGEKYETIFGRGASITSNPEPSPKQAEWDAFKKDVEQQYRSRKTKQLGDIEDSYRREKQKQQAIAGTLSLVSPSASFVRFISDVCATGEIDKTKYLEAVHSHNLTLESQLYSHVKRTTLILPSGGTASTSSIDQMVDLKTLPRFSIPKTSLSEVIGRNSGSLISLAFWLIAPFAVAHLRFVRYDVR